MRQGTAIPFAFYATGENLFTLGINPLAKVKKGRTLISQIWFLISHAEPIQQKPSILHILRRFNVSLSTSLSVVALDKITFTGKKIVSENILAQREASFLFRVSQAGEIVPSHLTQILPIFRGNPLPMKSILALLSNRFIIWLLMSIPGIILLWEFAAGEVSYKGVIHETGEVAVRLLIVTLLATPLAMMFPSAWLTKWLVLNRRYIGLATFGYVFLHSLFFLLDQRVRGVNEQEFFSFGIWTGWLASVFFLLLAITSNDYAMKELGRDWKTVQRFVYIAAVLTLLHWVYVDVRHQEWGPALLHFSPVIILSVYRVYRLYIRKGSSG